MKTKIKFISSFVMLIFSFSLLTYAQVKTKGEIRGYVVDENDEVLPGVTVTLTGENLFQNSLSQVTNEKGVFRLLNLNPGTYELEFVVEGFNKLNLKNVVVKVGAEKSIKAVLSQKKQQETITVFAEAPLIDTKNPEISTNISTVLIENIPTNRNVVDWINAAPGINDHGAYGAGGLRSSHYTQGSAANSFRLNGVDVSNLTYGTSWMRPNYETVDEIQIVGVGASAEYGNFTGAVINVVTKSGSNEFHGGLNFVYTNSNLWGDNNDRNLKEWEHDEVKYNPDFTVHIGGPIIKEKLFFFLAGGFTANKTWAFEAPDATTMKTYHTQLKVDWLLNKNNTFSFMFNYDPFRHENLGLAWNAGPEIAHTRKLDQYTFYGSYQSILSQNSFLTLKYLGFSGTYEQLPVSPDTVRVTEYFAGQFYGSSGLFRQWIRNRNELHADITYFADDLLGSSHEFKLGAEYEHSKAKENEALPGGYRLYVYPFRATETYIRCQADWDYNTDAWLNRISAYFQDNILIGKKLSLNFGFRFDNPRLYSIGMEGSVSSFYQWSPRIGFSYDITGDSKTIFHTHYGRYYDKVNIYGLKFIMPGLNWNQYQVYLPYRLIPDGKNTDQFIDLVYKPENKFSELVTAQNEMRMDNMPHTDALTIRLERQLTTGLVMSLDYIYKRDGNMFQRFYDSEHTYVKEEQVDPYTGIKYPFWRQTDSNPDGNVYFANSDLMKRRHHIVILSFRTQQTRDLYLMTSFTFQDSKGNVDNRDEEQLGLGWKDFDKNPNLYENPYMWGTLEYSHKYQFKLLASYKLPLGFLISGDLRLRSGKPYSYKEAIRRIVPRTKQSGRLDFVLIEPRGSRVTSSYCELNLRLQKSLQIGIVRLDLYADALNVFNNKNDWRVWIQTWRVWNSIKESSLDDWTSLADPRHLLIGARLSF